MLLFVSCLKNGQFAFVNGSGRFNKIIIDYFTNGTTLYGFDSIRLHTTLYGSDLYVFHHPIVTTLGGINRGLNVQHFFKLIQPMEYMRWHGL